MVSVRPVKSRRDLSRFILLSWKIYRNDAAWIPPLLFERKQALDRKKNPFFEHAEGELFLAERGGETVGRIAAHIDRLHNEIHGEKTGFFGFFESIPDQQGQEVSKNLLDQAASWLRQRGMKTMRGPFSFSINEECGILVDGFEHPPMILMGHNPPYYPRLLEEYGMKKVKDLYCWRYDPLKPIPEGALQIAEEVRRHPGLTVREVDLQNFEHDVRIIQDVFNSAWRKNWGFVPLTEKETTKATEEFQKILDPRIALIAEVDKKPAAICVALPNINEAIRDLDGRLFPLGFLKLLYRLKCHRIRSGRLMLLGIKEEYRGTILGGLSVLLYVEIRRRGLERGYRMGELSWTLEDNQKINAGIEFMGGERYKTYRIYEKEMSP